MAIKPQLKAVFLIAILCLVKPVNAAMIEGNVSPRKGDRLTTFIIPYELDSSVTNAQEPRVKVFLNQWVNGGFDCTMDYTLKDYFSVDVNNLSPITVVMTDIPNDLYRVGLKLAVKKDGVTKYYSDCDSENEFLLFDESEINIHTTTEVLEEFVEVINVSFSAITPKQVVIGESFLLNITVFNQGTIDESVKVYSYVHEGARLVSDGSWDSNAEWVTLSPGNSVNVQLINTVTEVGEFTLTARIDYGLKSSIKKSIEVVKPYSLDLLLTINEGLVKVGNTGLNNRSLRVTVYSNNELSYKDLTLGPKKYDELVIQPPALLLIHEQGELLLEQLINASPQEESINLNSINGSAESINESINSNSYLNQDTDLDVRVSNSVVGSQLIAGLNESVDNGSVLVPFKITGLPLLVGRENLLYCFIVVIAMSSLWVILR